MEAGKKKFRIKLKESLLDISDEGIINNRDKEITVSDNGDFYVEKVGDLRFLTRSRRRELPVEDIDKINGSLVVFSLRTGLTVEQIFDLGQKDTYSTVNTTRYYPLDAISVLMKNDSGITTITDQCVIDNVNGRIEIPPHLSQNLFSFVYRVKKIKVEKTIKLEVPAYKENGIGIITT